NSNCHGGEIPETTAATSTEPASRTVQGDSNANIYEFAMMLASLFVTFLGIWVGRWAVTATGDGYELSAFGRVIACVPAAMSAAYAVVWLVAKWRVEYRQRWLTIYTKAVPAA